MKTVYASWEEYDLPISTRSDLEIALNNAIIEARELKIPVAFELQINESILMCSVGGERSMIVFTENKRDFHYVKSSEDVKPAIEYLYHGSHTEVDFCRTVPELQAQEALFNFYETGHRPTTLPWSTRAS